LLNCIKALEANMSSCP